MPVIVKTTLKRIHTREQITGYFTEALEIVRELEIDAEHFAVFAMKAVDLCSQSQVLNETHELGGGGMAIPRGH